jgi:hypothetical protein
MTDEQQPPDNPDNPADRFVLADMLTATARSLGWHLFAADTDNQRVTVTFTTDRDYAPPRR